MTTEQKIKKWSIILGMLPIDKKYYDVISEYCEKYSDVSAKESTIDRFTSALNVLSKLDLSKVIFTDDKNICQTSTISVKVDPYDAQDIRRQLGIDVIEMYSSLMREELILHLNDMINKDGGVVINELFSVLDFVKTSNNIEVESYILPLNVYRYKKLNKIVNKINERN